MKSIRLGAVVCLFTLSSGLIANAQALHRIGAGQAPVQAEPEAPAKRPPVGTTAGEVSSPESGKRAVPRLIKFSGVLKELAGRPFASAQDKPFVLRTQGEPHTVGLTFALYQEQEGGAPLWLETQNVELDGEGRYTVLLGVTKSEGLPLELFAAGEARWLGIQAWGEEEQPRILLVSVPYALKAEEAEKLAGRRLEDFVLAEQLRQQVREVVQTEAQTLGLAPKLQTSSEPGAAAALAGATNFVDTTTDQVVFIDQQGAGLALSAQAPSNTAILGVSNATTGAFFGVRGESFSAEGNGVFGFNRAAAGTAIAVRGLSLSPGGRGVLGEARAATGTTFGVQGLNLSTSGLGVYGVATATSGGTVGVKGESFSTSGTGVIGVARGITGVTAGLSGVTESNSGRGLFGLAVAPSGPTIGLLGIAHSPAGFAGVFDNKGGGKILSLRNNTVEKAAFDGSGNLNLTGSLTSGGNVTATGTLSGASLVASTGSLTGALNVGGNLDLASGTLTLGSGNLTLTRGSLSVGGSVTIPTGTLSLGGSLTASGGLKLPATGTADAAQGFASSFFDVFASVFNSGTTAAENQTFRWRAEPVANNSASPSAKLSLLFGAGANPPAATGLSINRDGTINFVPGQTFPGAGGGISNVTGTPPIVVGSPTADTRDVSLSTTGCVAGEIWKWTGIAWDCVSDNDSGGTVTSVGSGAGLTGGPITSTGTLSVLFGGPGTQSLVARSDHTHALGTGNTGVGAGVLTVNGGSSNTALGFNALTANTFGGNNTAVGALTLDANTTGASNTAVGVNALGDNSTGSGNTAVGASALAGSTDGINNTALGFNALRANTGGGANTAVGVNALLANTASSNTAVGTSALDANTTGVNNTAVGANALGANTTGVSNTAVGQNALLSNTADNNTAVGRDALGANTTGAGNTAVGSLALFFNTSGTSNIAVGAGALFANGGGIGNTAVGNNALAANTTGFGNIAIGSIAGFNATTGNNNIYIGDPGLAAEGNTIRIGGQSVQTATFIAGIAGATASGGVGVFVNSDGKLGTFTSSARAKEAVEAIGAGGQRLLRLRPVQFRYKPEYDDGSRLLQYGLIAEEVEEVFPELVAYGREGQPETVRYHLLPALLLNELQRQEAKLAALDGELTELRNVLATQAAEIEELKAALRATLAARESDAKRTGMQR